MPFALALDLLDSSSIFLSFHLPRRKAFHESSAASACHSVQDHRHPGRRRPPSIFPSQLLPADLPPSLRIKKSSPISWSITIPIVPSLKLVCSALSPFLKLCDRRTSLLSQMAEQNGIGGDSGSAGTSLFFSLVSKISTHLLTSMSIGHRWPRLVSEVSICDNEFELTIPWPRFGTTKEDLQQLVGLSPHGENAQLIGIGLTEPPQADNEGTDRSRGTITGILLLIGTESRSARITVREFQRLVDVELNRPCRFYELAAQCYWLLKL